MIRNLHYLLVSILYIATLVPLSTNAQKTQKSFNISSDFQIDAPREHQSKRMTKAEVISKKPSSYKAEVILEKVVQNNLENVSARLGSAACLEPTLLTKDNISRTTAELGWTSNSGGDSWEIEIVETGEAPTESGDVVTTNPYTVTGLTPGTSYDFYVREICEEVSETGELVITGILDGPLPGGLPKIVEFEAIGDIEDLSIYGTGRANNGTPNTGVLFTFPSNSILDGEVIYLTKDSASFSEFMGFNADYISDPASNFNGNDVFLLFKDSTEIVDVYGEEGVDGVGRLWEYTDGWAYRMDLNGSNGGVFDSLKWTYSGANALDGDTLNSTSLAPFPINTYVPPAPGDATSEWVGPETFTTQSGNVDNCFAGTLSSSELQLVCPGESANIKTTGDELIPNDGTYGFLFTRGSGATGGIPGPDFTITGPVDYTFDNTLNGSLTGAGLQPLTGNWTVRGLTNATGSITAATICGYTGTAANILFRDEQSCEESCDAGTIAITELQEVCPGETGSVEINDDADIPDGGGYAFQFIPGPDGIGGNGVSHTLAVPNNSITFNNDLNGKLSLDELDPFEGTWYVFGVAYTDQDDVEGSICSITEDSVAVNFKDSIECETGSEVCLSFSSGEIYEDFLIPPCGAECGEPITADFQILSGEAYLIEGTAGSEYTFEFCDGYDEAEWSAVISVAIFDEDNEQAAIGGFISSREGCSITWVSPFDTTYIMIISERGTCGSPSSNAPNGSPTLDCGPNGAACPAAPGCLEFAGGLFTSLVNTPCEATCGEEVTSDIEVKQNQGYLVRGTEGSDYTFDICEGYDENTWSALLTVGIYDRCSEAAIPNLVFASEEGCSVTWTADRDALYVVVVSELDSCGAPFNPFSDSFNGLPTIKCGPEENATCPTIPSNDDCDNAQVLTLFSDSTSCVATRVSTIGATPSETPTDICIPDGEDENLDIDDDVWFSFSTGADIPVAGVVIQATLDETCNESSIFNIGMAVYEGCDNGPTIICSTGDQLKGIIDSSSLSSNTTYLIRLWSVGNSVLDQGGFDLCVYEAPLPEAPVCLDYYTGVIGGFEVSPPYSDIETPPCGDDCGSSVVAQFPVWANESYTVNATAGSEYTVEFCTGYDANVWEAAIAVALLDTLTGEAIEGTVIANTEGCSITFTTPETATYIVVISSVGNCGGIVDTLNNGILTISCGPNGAVCPGDEEFDCTTTPISIAVDSVINSTVGSSDGSAFITVTGGTEPYDFNWSDGTETEDLTNVGSNTYTLMVTDTNGCMATTEVEILSENGDCATLSFTATTTPEDCNKDNGTVAIVAVGGTPPYTYDWPDIISTENISSVTGISEGAFIFTLRDSNNCEVTNTIVVNGNRPDIVVNSVTNESCVGNSDGAIDVTVTEGEPPYSVIWSNGDTTESISGLDAGFYKIDVEDSEGCVFSRTIEVKAAVVNLRIDSTTSATGGEDNGGISVTINGESPTSDYTYLLDDQEVTLETLENGVGAGPHTVQVVDENGCESEVLSVTVNNDVGIELLSFVNELSIYPNPTRNVVNIFMDLDQVRKVGFSLMSYDGKLLEQISEDNIRSKTFRIDLSKYNSGIYFVNILIDEERMTRRVSFIK